eukprot:Gb_30696 [translate_table: standard]
MRHIVSPSKRWIRTVKQLKGCIKQYGRSIAEDTNAQIQQAEEELTQIFSQSNSGRLTHTRGINSQRMWAANIMLTRIIPLSEEGATAINDRMKQGISVAEIEEALRSLPRNVVQGVPTSGYKCYHNHFGPKAKVVLTRLAPFMQELVSDAQSAFVKGRRIADNIMIVSEAIHSARTWKIPLMLLKLDVSKVFDAFEWNYILAVLKSVGHPTQRGRQNILLSRNANGLQYVKDIRGAKRCWDFIQPSLAKWKDVLLSKYCGGLQVMDILQGFIPRSEGSGIWKLITKHWNYILQNSFLSQGVEAMGLTKVADFYDFQGKTQKNIAVLLADDNGYLDHNLVILTDQINDEIGHIIFPAADTREA